MSQNLGKLLDIRQRSVMLCAEKFCENNTNHDAEHLKIKNALDKGDIKLLEIWYDQKFS